MLDAAGSKQAPVLPAPIVSYRWCEAGGSPAPLPGLPAMRPRLELKPLAEEGEYRIALTVMDTTGRTDRSVTAVRVDMAS